MVWMWMGQAQAQEWVVEWRSDPAPTRTATCDGAEGAILGTASVQDGLGPVSVVQGTRPVPGAWEGTVDWVPGVNPGYELTDLTATTAALCVSDEAASCARTETTVIPAGRYASLGAVAQCPEGTFLLGGGARLTGNAEGVAFESVSGTGMFALDALQARADRIGPGGAGAWGIEVTAVCVPPEVLEATTLYTLPVWWASAFAWEDLGPGLTGPHPYAGMYASDPPKACTSPLFLSANGAGDHFVTSTGWGRGWYQGQHSFWSESRCGGTGQWDPASGCPDAPYADQLLCGLPEDLERSLLTCGEGPPRPVVDRFRVGGRVMFGVADGSDGFVWVPGEGPVPVGPQPFREAFAATPVAVTTYADARARDEWIRQVGVALDEEGTRWRRTDDLSMVADTDQMLIVTPSDEVAAVQWLERNRERLDPNRAAPVVLFLERGGAAVRQLHQW